MTTQKFLKKWRPRIGVAYRCYWPGHALGLAKYGDLANHLQLWRKQLAPKFHAAYERDCRELVG